MTPDNNSVNPWIVTGIGTYVGGQKAVGAMQAALALAGGLLSLCLVVVLFRLAMTLNSAPFDTESFMEANGTLLGLGGSGLGLLAIASVWAAVSSFIVIKITNRS